MRGMDRVAEQIYFAFLKLTASQISSAGHSRDADAEIIQRIEVTAQRGPGEAERMLLFQQGADLLYAQRLFAGAEVAQDMIERKDGRTTVFHDDHHCHYIMRFFDILRIWLKY